MSQKAEIVKGVYFIFAPAQNKIKIGRSKDINKRFIQLRTGFMDEGILLFGIKSDDEVKLENEIHKKFSFLRENGEWFLVTKDLINFINKVESQYDEIIYFEGFHVLRKNQSYSSKEVFEYYKKIHSFTKKVIQPTLLLLFGLIIACNNFSMRSNAEGFEIYINYFLLIFYPLLTPYLALKVLEHQSIKVLKLFTALILFTYIFEIGNLMIELNTSFVFIIRTILISISFSFFRFIAFDVFAIERYDRNRKIVEEEIYQINDLNKLKEFGKQIAEELEKVENKSQRFISVVVFIAYLIFNFYLLTIDFDNTFKYGLLGIVNIGGILSLINKYFSNKLKTEQKKHISNIISSAILPICMFIILMLTSTIESYKPLINFTWGMATILLFFYIITGSIVINKRQRTLMQLKEIKDKIEQNKKHI